jgi:gamma-glutamyl hercynylcysteine S-oxide synthase
VNHAAFPDGYTRDDILDWYRRNRATTRELFDLITPDAYYERPIALRNPIVFYEGHLPAFNVNTLLKLTHGRAGADARLETLFARGIDPESEAAVKSPTDIWPSRDDVQAYADAADALVLDALAEVPIGEAVFTILEHEQMHHETLLYMFHNLPYPQKTPSPRWSGRGWRAAPGEGRNLPQGVAHLGTAGGTFGWDNEFPAHSVDVDAFEITPVITNADYREFVDATHAKPPHFWSGDQWRGMFALEPMPWDAPVYVTHDEAASYARWKGMRLPTEAEYHRAELPVGHGWEWTSSVFAPFDGFAPMPSYREYSADFFDGAHFVLKGASPVTPRELIRPGFRNWFRPNYPYVYATFRCARDVHGRSAWK